MYRRNFAKSSAPSIPSFGAVSLTGPGWMLRHKDAWEEKHHVFFGKSSGFYENTATAQARAQNQKTGHLKTAQSLDSWVCETSDGQEFGRAQIQVTSGDFRHGFLFIELAKNPDALDPMNAFGELITSQFVGCGLDTLKIMPVGTLAQDCLRRLSPDSQNQVLAFSNEFLKSPVYPLIYQFDREQWISSAFGKSFVERLSWLSRRVERAQSASHRKQQETKRPWLFALLARNRKREEHMVHPLDKIRSRSY